jgi:hypothetical protein
MDLYGYHVFENKAYGFKRRQRMNTHFGIPIWGINYSLVLVRDLENPQDKPRVFRTHYQHEELKKAPVCHFNMFKKLIFEIREDF